MRRAQLEHAIRTACQIIERSEVIVIGAQAILGTYDELQLPVEATMSIEVDILPLADTDAETVRLSNLIEGVAGELSPFEALHGFSIDGVDLQTAVLPLGWRGRLVEVRNDNAAAPTGSPQFTGWCLDKEDLCVAKSIAGREKDLRFVGALLDAGRRGRGEDRAPAQHRARAQGGVRACPDVDHLAAAELINARRATRRRGGRR